MAYFISFLEGIITFISPCLLPMLPIYITYFAGGGVRNTRRTLMGALGFVLGFTLVFVAMGALAGTVGSFLTRHQQAVNIVSGIIVTILGLSFLGLFRIPLFQGRLKLPQQTGFFASLLFGIVFSVGWTPCVGVFLGSALMLASQQGSILVGVGMLLCYSLGLGIPFVISAILIDYLKSALDLIKRNYRTINIISGCLLIAMGLAMATGVLGSLLRSMV